MNLPLWNLQDAYILSRPDPHRLTLMGGIFRGAMCPSQSKAPANWRGLFSLLLAFNSSRAKQFF